MNPLVEIVRRRLQRWLEIAPVRSSGRFSPGPAGPPGGYETIEIDGQAWIRVRDFDDYLERKRAL